MKLKLSQLEQLLTKAASKFISPQEAKYFAKEQIDTHIKKAPRVNALEAAIRDLQSWQDSKDRNIKIQVDKGASLLINFNKLAPSLKLKYLHDQLEKRSKKHGIAALGLNNTAGLHVMNLLSDGLGKRDLIGICFFNGGPRCVIPYGGTKGVFGTNPISYAIPTSDKPILVDMATSVIPIFELRQADKKGNQLKANAAVDQKGRPTTDPSKTILENNIKNLLPIGGGYKGSAVTLLVEVLTGSLVRSLIGNEKSDLYTKEELGGLLIAIDVKSFTNLNKFKKSVSKMCQDIRAQKPSPKTVKVLMPGDKSYQRANNTRKKGVINIDKEIYTKLKNLSNLL